MLKTDQNSNKKGTWNNKTPEDIEESLLSANKLKSMRETDLRVIVRYLKKSGYGHLKESDNKTIKLRKIFEVLGLQCIESTPENVTKKTSTKRIKRVVKSLKDIAFSALSKLRKMDLNIIYAEYVWPEKLSKWQQNALHCNTQLYEDTESVCSTNNAHESSEIVDSADNSTDSLTVTISGTENHVDPNKATTENCQANAKDCPNRNQFSDFFYIPAYSSARRQYEVSCIDSSHLLTRTRRKCCKGGLDGCSNAAWNKVAKSGKTNLSVAMTEAIIDQMSVPTAVTHFSESVENEMVQAGDVREASLCRDIRQWWKSDDDAGISARERVKMRMPLRRRLLNHIQFGHFPPPGMYVKGWPTQLWEAILANIDAKTVLYALSKQKTYNTRAFSSLVGETFFSELTLYDRRGQGTVTSAEFQAFMGTAVEKLHMRLDKDRTFAYRTCRKTVYNLLDEKEFGQTDNDDSADEDISLHDHFFDMKERARVKGRKKEEMVSSSRNAVLRGSLGVRWEKARRDDSKVLPTIRMGIDLKQ